MVTRIILVVARVFWLLYLKVNDVLDEALDIWKGKVNQF